MALSVFNKENIRAIGSSLERFLAIAAIVALGTGFYAGLNMTEPDMKLAADRYYDGTNLMDIRVVSTMGLTDDDVDAIADLPNVGEAMGAYELDVVADILDDQYTMRVHSLPDGATRATMTDAATIEFDGEGYINRLELIEGAWPSASGQCVIGTDRVMNDDLQVGDTVTFTEGSVDLADTLATDTYTISGFVRSSYYPSSTSFGTTTLGIGTIQQYMFIPADDFLEDVPYTSVYATAANAKDAFSGSDEYDDCVQKAVSEIEKIEPAQTKVRLAQVREQAQEKLDENKATFEEESAQAEVDLAQAKQDLDDAKKQIDENAAVLASSQDQYEIGLDSLSTQEATTQSEFEASQRQIDAQSAEADRAAEQIPGLEDQLRTIAAQLENPDLPDDQRQQLLGQSSYLQAAIAEIREGQNKVKEAQSYLDSQKEAAENAFAQKRGELEQAKLDIDKGNSELEEARRSYETGLEEYSEAREEADEALADGRSELEQAQDDIDTMKAPEWLILDRDKNPGIVSFESDAERVGAIGSIFPFIFFLVAALVALTTMTRMVDDDRMLIGTFKSLGFSRGRITAKYLIYAALSSVGGSVVGIVVLSQLLPLIIMHAYSIVYSVPSGGMPVDLLYAVLAAGLGVGVTLAATCAAALGTLRQPAAELLRPATPPEGKRIFLEYIFPLWYRMSFTWKITCRNIFRYKKRFVMTVVGIAGCTALVLTGFGLQNSIHDIISVQYGELVNYNVVVMTDDELDERGQRDLDTILNESYVYNYAFSQDESVLVPKEGESVSDASMQATLVVPQDAAKFQELWTMRTRTSHQAITCGPDEVVVTEKLASMAGVGVGDAITVSVPDSMGNATDDTHTATVTGIMENYVSNYVFMGADAYEAAFGEEPVYHTVYADVSEDERSRDAFVASIRSINGVKTVSFNDEVIETYETMLNSVNMVVVVLVVSAALLAFVVLYNLANINITERAREIATLKVLGFLRREVDSYIFREIILLSVIGALFGLILGALIESFVVVTAEVDYVMFGRTIHWWSFLVSFALTIVFTLIVLFFMRFKLDRIDMIQSLKSNE